MNASLMSEALRSIEWEWGDALAVYKNLNLKVINMEMWKCLQGFSAWL